MLGHSGHGGKARGGEGWSRQANGLTKLDCLKSDQQSKLRVKELGGVCKIKPKIMDMRPPGLRV